MNGISTYEMLLSNCFVEGKETYYIDYEKKYTCDEFVRMLWKAYVEPEELYSEEVNIDLLTSEELAEFMYENLQFGYKDIVGLIAWIYMSIWTKAELYEKYRRETEDEKIDAIY